MRPSMGVGVSVTEAVGSPDFEAVVVDALQGVPGSRVKRPRKSQRSCRKHEGQLVGSTGWGNTTPTWARLAPAEPEEGASRAGDGWTEGWRGDKA